MNAQHSLSFQILKLLLARVLQVGLIILNCLDFDVLVLDHDITLVHILLVFDGCLLNEPELFLKDLPHFMLDGVDLFLDIINHLFLKHLEIVLHQGPVFHH